MNRLHSQQAAILLLKQIQVLARTILEPQEQISRVVLMKGHPNNLFAQSSTPQIQDLISKVHLFHIHINLHRDFQNLSFRSESRILLQNFQEDVLQHPVTRLGIGLHPQLKHLTPQDAHLMMPGLV